MKRKTMAFDAVSILQVVLAVFFFTIGLIGIIDWNSGVAAFGRSLSGLFGRANDPFNIIVAIIDLAAGLIICAALFVAIRTRFVYWVTIVVGAVMIVELIIGFFAYKAFEPDFLVWLNRLSADLVILIGLWMINRRYA